MRTAQGSRDKAGVWSPHNPDDYPPIAVHGIWPWSTLDQSLPAWKTRRQHWAGIVDDTVEVRRHSAGMITSGRHGTVSGGVSKFDPVLTELLYTWFCPPHGRVWDPFTGGPVRGVVAHTLNLAYLGVDINPAQVAANQEAHRDLGTLWTVGDGTRATPPSPTDFILTCPPYHRRERYTDLPQDLSNVSWGRFIHLVGQTMQTCFEALTTDRFMAWVVSDVRDSRGHLRDLPGMVDSAARQAGFHLCNELVLIAPPGTRAKTTRPPWEACRTTSRRHQLVLVWVKGDRRVAAKVARDAH